MNGKNENGANSGRNDIVEAELPVYAEEQSAIPDVETENSFAENREEAFLRNREIAARSEGVYAYREEFPENPDAEEIYPQLKAAPEDRLPQKAADSALPIRFRVTEAYAGTDGKNNIFKRFKAIHAAIIAMIAVIAIIVVSNTSLGGASINAAAIEKADEKAKNAHTAASVGLVQLAVEGTEISGDRFENSGTVFSFGGTEVNAAEYLGNNFTGHIFGKYDAEIGAVEYALWSAEPIPEEYRRLLSDSEQETLSKKGIIIGCYPAVE